MPDQSPRPLTTLRARGLGGRFRVPGDSGLFCLAAMLGAGARGETVIYADTTAPDRNFAAVLELLRALGVRTEQLEDRWQIHGLGPLGLLAPVKPVDFTDADRALPLALGLVAPYEFTTRFISERRGQSAPAGLIGALRAMGAEIGEHRGGQLPITIRGPRSGVPQAGLLGDEGFGSKAALMLAALALPGISRLVETSPAAEEAERLFRYFGATIETATSSGGRQLGVIGLPALGARTLAVAGDAELAGLVMVAGLIVPDADLVMENVPVNASRLAVLSSLEAMGGRIEIGERRLSGGEEIAELRVRHSALLGIEVSPAGLTPAGMLALAVAGAFAGGETRLPRLGFAGEAKLHQALVDALLENGATARLDTRGLTVGRPALGGRLGGGVVAAAANPLIAAAFMIFGLAAEQVTIEDGGRVEANYPGLVGGLEALGAEFFWRVAT